MLIRSYAKINLALKVKGKLENGYHELDMVMVPLQLRDSIEITLLPAHFDTHIICQDFDLGGDEYNTCRMAVNKLREKFGFKNNFLIKIHKKIPMSAGLGGGSSNAAVVLQEIVKMLKLKITDEELVRIGLSIGSDVPFFLTGKPARVQGEGEIITPVRIKNRYTVMLVKPKNGLSTQKVYRAFDEAGPAYDADDSRVVGLISALEKGNEEEITVNLFNDLERPAVILEPEIAKIISLLKADKFTNVHMTGSGSSVYVMIPGIVDLLKYEAKYEKLGYKVVVTSIRG